MISLMEQAQGCDVTTWPDVALGALIIGLFAWFLWLSMR